MERKTTSTLAEARARVDTRIKSLRAYLDEPEREYSTSETSAYDRLRLEELMAEVDAEKLAYEIEWERYMEELREQNRRAEEQNRSAEQERLARVDRTLELEAKRQATFSESQRDFQREQKVLSDRQAKYTRVLCILTGVNAVIVLLVAILSNCGGGNS